MGVAGKTFVITGKIVYPGGRAALMQFISSKGGFNASSITRSVDYLITSDPHSNSHKNQRVREFGVKLIGEDDLMRMCEEDATL